MYTLEAMLNIFSAVSSVLLSQKIKEKCLFHHCQLVLIYTSVKRAAYWIFTRGWLVKLEWFIDDIINTEKWKATQ